MSEAAPPPRHRRRPFRVAAAAAALAVAAAAAWYGWLWYTTPAPPNVPLDGLEPDVAAAIRSAVDRVRREGRSGAAWGALGQVLLAHEFDDPCDACFAQAERFDSHEPRWPYYRGTNRALTRPEEALPFLRRAVELADKVDRGNDAPRLRLAETLRAAGADAEAEEQLTRVLAWDPDNPRVHFDLGVLAEGRADDETAVRHFTLSAKSPYARRKSYIRLAAIRQRHGDSDGAADYGRRAAAPPDDFLWDDRYVGDYERLQAGRRGRYEEVERLEAEGRFADALPIFLGLAEDASDARAQIALGVALMQLNRVEEAERRFRQAVGKSSEQVEANYGLAVALYTEGEQRFRGAAPEAARPKFAEAVTYADAALKLNPDHAMALLYRGKALGALGRGSEAIDSIRQAVLRRPELVDTHLGLAEALEAADRRPEAVVEYRRAAEVAPPTDRRPRAALERLHVAGGAAD